MFFKKNIIVLFFIYIIAINCFSQEDSLFKEANSQLCILTTEHFDIIFSEKSQITALRIYEKCESFYTEICEKLNTKTYFRIPVCITADTDRLNGFYSPEPYHRIVLFDTIPNEGMLTSYNQTILSIFYHELTHAISMGIRSPFWEGMSKIFSDALSPGQIFYLPLSFLEGATVSFESMHGDGRLNDEFSRHILKQTKAQGIFLKWTEIAGARDVYPVGSLPYIFGGAFSAYLQNHYGVELYAKYWHECGKINFFKLTPGVIKKVYNKSIEELWQEFYDSVEVAENFVNLILDTKNIVIPPKNTKIIYSLASCSSGIAFVSAQDSCVYFVDSDNQKKRKLFTCDSSSTQKISFSLDGRYLTYSYILEDNFATNVCRIFDMKKNKIVKTFFGYRDGCILNINSTYVFAGVKTISQNMSINFFDIEDNKKEINLKTIDFEYDNQVFGLCDASNGYLGFILKQEDKWQLALYNTQSKSFFIKNVDYKPYNLQSQFLQNNIYLTYAFNEYQSKDFSHAAIAQVDLSKQNPQLLIKYDYTNYLGGVFNPILKENQITKEQELCFVNKFFEEDYLVSVLPNIKKSQEVVFDTFFNKNNTNERLILENQKYDLKKYRPIKNLHKGIFLPFPLIAFNKNLESITDADFFQNLQSLGIFYYTKDPAQIFALSTELSYNFNNNYIDFYTNVKNNVGDFLLTTDFQGSYSFDNHYKALGSFSLFKDFPIVKSYNLFSVSNQINIKSLSWNQKVASWQIENSSLDNDKFYYLEQKHELQNTFSVGFQNYHRKFNGKYSILGFSTKLSLFTNIKFNFADLSKIEKINIQPCASFQFSLPMLLPIINPNNFTINLPFVFSMQFFPTSKAMVLQEDENKKQYVQQKNILFTMNTQNVVFSYDIQKAIGKTPIYLNRIKTDFITSFLLVPEENEINYWTNPFYYLQDLKKNELFFTLTLKNSLHFSIIVGALTNAQIKVDFNLNYSVTNQELSFNMGGAIEI